MTEAAVSYTLDGDLAVVGIDDGKANALSPGVLAAIDAALDRAADEARAVVLHGRPGRFSAGFDLSIMTSGVDAMRALVEQGAEVALRMFTFPLPVVVAGTGHALAMGAILLLAADHRVGAAGDFKVGLNEVSIGMSLPIFGVELARYRLGARHFDAATVQATVYAPNEAVEAGFLDRVVDGAEVVAEAKTDAARLASFRSGAFRITKEQAHGATAALIRATLAADIAQLGPPG